MERPARARAIVAIILLVHELSDRAELAEFLSRHQITPQKGLGQHFLCSPAVTSAIVGQLVGMRGVLEIGPGPGTLTQALCGAGLEVAAIELDERMRPAIESSAPCARVHFGDALRMDWRPLLASLPEPKSVVSNMPYQITGPLLGRVSEFRDAFDRAVLMMQREVAARVLATPGDRSRGALSVVLQSQFEIQSVCDAPPGAFVPPPKVSSAVLRFVPKRTSFATDESAFFVFVRRAFRMPRKTLANNLVAAGMTRDRAEKLLLESGVEPRARPCDLAFEEWIELWNRSRIA